MHACMHARTEEEHDAQALTQTNGSQAGNDAQESREKTEHVSQKDMRRLPATTTSGSSRVWCRRHRIRSQDVGSGMAATKTIAKTGRVQGLESSFADTAIRMVCSSAAAAAIKISLLHDDCPCNARLQNSHIKYQLARLYIFVWGDETDTP